MSGSNLQAIPPEVANAFQAATTTALQELMQVEAYPDLSAAEGMPSEAVVLASIRLLRPSPGTMTLVVTAETASRLAARYLPTGTPLSDDLIDDVTGEFANVIAGQAKTILKGTLFHFTLSTPVVTRPERRDASSAVVDAGRAASMASELGRVLVLVDLLPCTNA